MSESKLRLGIDFGTSNTVAVLSAPDGRIRPLLFDGSELLPSAVCACDNGDFLVGRDAIHAARAYPTRFEPHPKRSIDDGVIVMDGAEVPVVDLFTAVLRRVAAEAHRVAGATLAPVVTCPAGWGSRRRQVLIDATTAAGLTDVNLVAEPVAAAYYFVEVADHRIPTQGCAVIYDFGAGTFDATVVRHTATGFEVLAQQGLVDAGGLDIDAAIIAYLGTVYAGRDAQLWGRLAHPRDAQDRRAATLLWDDVRTAKEVLSRASSTLIHIPLFDDETTLGRDQLEQLAHPVLERTVKATQMVIAEAGIRKDEIAGIFLVGGSSRIPLAATLLYRSIGLPPTVLERPELVVAEGSLHVPLSTTPTVWSFPPNPEVTPTPHPPSPAPPHFPRPDPGSNPDTYTFQNVAFNPQPNPGPYPSSPAAPTTGNPPPGSPPPWNQGHSAPTPQQQQHQAQNPYQTPAYIYNPSQNPYPPGYPPHRPGNKTTRIIAIVAGGTALIILILAIVVIVAVNIDDEPKPKPSPSPSLPATSPATSPSPSPPTSPPTSPSPSTPLIKDSGLKAFADAGIKRAHTCENGLSRIVNDSSAKEAIYCTMPHGYGVLYVLWSSSTNAKDYRSRAEQGFGGKLAIQWSGQWKSSQGEIKGLEVRGIVTNNGSSQSYIYWDLEGTSISGELWGPANDMDGLIQFWKEI